MYSYILIFTCVCVYIYIYPKGLRPHAAGPSGVSFVVSCVSRYVFAGCTLHYFINATNINTTHRQGANITMGAVVWGKANPAQYVKSNMGTSMLAKLSYKITTKPVNKTTTNITHNKNS